MTAAPDHDRDRCPSCRVLWTQHLGIQGTCAELIEATKEIERLKALQAEAVRAAVEEERERCAKAVEEGGWFINDSGFKSCTLDGMARTIREAPR